MSDRTEANKKYYYENKMKISERKKNYYKENREHMLERNKNFRENNREYFIEYKKKIKEIRYKSLIKNLGNKTWEYKLNECKDYYEGYIYKNKKNIIDNLDIFKDDFIEIENVETNKEDEKQLLFLSKPDFIFDKTCLNEISKYNVHIKNNKMKYITSHKIYWTLQNFIITHVLGVKLKENTVVTFKENKYYDYRVNNLIFVNKSLVNNKKKSNAKSSYKGVTKKRQRYSSIIYKNNEKFHLGVFETPEEAAEVYNIKARELFGKFAYQNVIPKKKVKI